MVTNGAVEDEVLDEIEVPSPEELSKIKLKDAFKYQEVVEIPDDFVVPCDFTEFISRYPRYIKTWLYRNHCPSFLVEDFEQEICLYMLKVSANGRAKGIYDRIVSFDGERIGGKSAGKFFFYVNLLIMRKWKVLIEKRLREPVDQRGTLSLTTNGNTEGDYIPGTITEEDLISKFGLSDSIILHSEYNFTTAHYIKGYVNFVANNEPELVPFVRALVDCSSLPDICRSTGLTLESVNLQRNRLRILAKVYDSGLSKIPKKRKVYNKRQTS